MKGKPGRALIERFSSDGTNFFCLIGWLFHKLCWSGKDRKKIGRWFARTYTDAQAKVSVYLSTS